MTQPGNSNPGRGGMDADGVAPGGAGFSGADVSATDFGGADLSAADLGGVDLSRVWTGVAAEIWRRHPGPAERLAARLLRSPGLARALVTTPSLLVPWLISTAVVFGLGGLVNVAGGRPLTWLLAPGVAAIGIAYAYGPGVDPAWELACSMPVSDRMVLLVRGVAVFAVNALLGIAVSLATYSVAAGSAAPKGTGAASAEAAAITVAWLLPMTAICALTLAVAVAARSANAGAAAGVAAWAATVLASGVVTGQFSAAVTNSSAYLPYLAVAACAVVATGYATRSQRRTP
jgi:hypothetical protein